MEMEPVERPIPTDTSNFLPFIPDNIKQRVALVDGMLHLSSELKGNLEMVSMVETLRRRGIKEYKFHHPNEFDKRFSHRVARDATPNEIQGYAVDLIKKARQSDASDVHIIDYGSYTIVQFRVLGLLEDYTQLGADFGKALISTIYQSLAMGDGASFYRTERQDGRIHDKKYLPSSVHSVRVHCEPIECSQGQDGLGTSMALRLLYDGTTASGTLTERLGTLGYFPEQCKTLEAQARRTGLHIISGPTGSGKSTLLKHVMESLVANSPGRSYYSIEDPPEVPMKGVRQVRVGTNSKVSRDENYRDAVAGAMRGDPDTIMIGEIRYVEAAAAAIEISLTSHACWTTLHASDALGIVTRLASLMAKDFAFPLDHICHDNVLASLVYQRLLPVLCPECKVRLFSISREKLGKHITSDVLERLSAVCDDMDGVHVRGPGCEKCKQRGVVSRTVAAEVIDMDQEMLRRLRKGNYSEASDYWLNDKGGKTYLHNAVTLIQNGTVDPAMAEEQLGVPLNFHKVYRVR